MILFWWWWKHQKGDVDQKDLWIIWITRINLITIITHWERLNVTEDLLRLYFGEDERQIRNSFTFDGWQYWCGDDFDVDLGKISTGSDWICWFSLHLKERPRHCNVKMLASVQLIWGAQTAMWWCVAPLYSTHNIITLTAKKYDPQFCHLCVPPLYSTYNIKVY